jgi:urea transport system permease protein
MVFSVCAVGAVGAVGAVARAATLNDALARFTADDFSETDTGINEIAATGSPRAEIIIRALQDGRLMFSAERKAVYIKNESDKLFDAATGAPVAGDPPADVDNVRINNRLRRSIDAALGGLTLLARDPGKRFDVAQAVFKSHEASALPVLETAIRKEQDARVKRALTEARAAVVLFSDEAEDADKLDAVAVLRLRGDQDALGMLAGLPSGTAAPVAKAAADAVATIQNRLAVWDAAQNA